MKLTHKGREIYPDAVDYGAGTVMVMYKDAGDNPNVAIVSKSEIVVEDE